ncbi:hypothetical protein [Sphingomonas sp. RB1R13]|uniref:hypothetical protein n=1 Tax=Sphingomonas sp. RB1R13 TaxID=3096159 RepID=UPI002FC984CA
MNDHQDHIDDDEHEVRAPTLSGDPERELELKLKKDPGNKSAQIDVGSDQSMDASDPPSATQPGGNDPVPSSGFPEKK